MLLSATTEAQREKAGTVRIAGMNHGGAAPAETHGSGIAALRDLLVNGKLTALQRELIAGDSRSELKCGSAHGLAIGAVTHPDPIRVNIGLPADIAAEAATVDAL
ncbi:MAG: hypothetical protein VW686_08880 [Luminiphilus sp.]